MKNTTYFAAGLITLTALISVVLWANGFPPPKEGLSEGKIVWRSIVTFPFFLAGLSSCLTVPIILVKARKLKAVSGKSRALPQVSMLMVPAVMLLLQIIMPLDMYGLISDSAGDLGLFGLIALFFFTIGNYAATIPYRAVTGFRTKATLSDPSVWTRTHRFLGRNIVFASLLMVPVAFLFGGKIAQWSLLGTVITIKAISFIYARQLSARAELRTPVT